MKFVKFMKGFSRRTKIILVSVLLLFGGFMYYRNSKANASVETAKVTKGTIKEEMVLSGTVSADEYAKLTFAGSGELTFMGVKEGQEVKKGEKLASLDTTILYQSYLQAQASLRRYQASLDSTYDTVQGHTTNESFAQIEARTIAETNKDNAYRAFVAAQENLSNATLKAPFDGVVSSITYPFTGINTFSTTPQIEILNPSTLYLDVSADQTEVIRLKVGQNVTIIFDSFPDKELSGKVDYVGLTPKAGEVGSVYSVKVTFVDLDGLNGIIKMGMTGDVKFTLSEKENVLQVPQKFIKSEKDGKYLYVGSKKNKVKIEVGIEGEDNAEIMGAIEEGDLIFN